MQEKLQLARAVPKDKGWAWMSLLGTAIVQFLVIGGCVDSFGVLFTTIQDKFDATTTQVAWIPATLAFSYLITATPANLLCRRFGTRPVVIVGGILMTVGFALSAFAQTIWLVYVTYGLTAGLGAGLSYAPSIVIIGTYFEKRRALAYGILFGSASVGSFVCPPVLRYSLDSYGLEGTCLLMGAVAFHATLSGMLFRPPQFYVARYLMRERLRRSTTQSQPGMCIQDDVVLKCNANTSNDITVGAGDLLPKKPRSQWNIMKNPLLYIYIVSFSLVDSTYHNMFTMLPPHASDIGIDSHKAVYLLTIAGLSGSVSRVLIGLFADFNLVGKKHFYLVSIAVCAVALWVFPLVGQFTHMAVPCAVCGTLAGAVSVLAPVLLAEEFGVVHISVTYGVMYSTSAFFYVACPVLMGFLRDLTGQWNDSFFVSGSLVMFAAILNLAEPWALKRGRKQLEHN